MFNLILRALPPGLYFLVLLYSPDDDNFDLFASILLTINLVKFSELGLRLTLEQRKKFEFNIKDIFYSTTSSLIIYSFCYFFFIAKLNFNFFEALILYFTCIMLTFSAITGAYFNIIDKLNRFYLILIFYPLYNFITLYLYGSEILIEQKNKNPRKITPLEACRLQGFPDQVISKAKEMNMSDVQLYKQFGNAVAVNVVRHIANNLLKAL